GSKCVAHHERCPATLGVGGADVTNLDLRGESLRATRKPHLVHGVNRQRHVRVKQNAAPTDVLHSKLQHRLDRAPQFAHDVESWLASSVTQSGLTVVRIGAQESDAIGIASRAAARTSASAVRNSGENSACPMITPAMRTRVALSASCRRSRSTTRWEPDPSVCVSNAATRLKPTEPRTSDPR